MSRLASNKYLSIRQLMRRPSAATAVIKAMNALLGMLTAVLLARFLEASGFGQYAFVYAVMTMLAIPTKLGLPQLVIRETAIALDNGRVSRVHAVWKWAHWMILFTTILIVLITVAGMQVFGTGIASSETFLMGLVLVPFIALGNLRGASLRGLGHVVLGQLPESILRPSFFNLAILGWVAVNGHTEFTASDALLLHVCAALATFIIGTVILIRRSPTIDGAQDESIQGRAMLFSAAALGAAAGLTTINNNLDIIMISAFRTAAEVGIYKPVVTIAGLVMFGLQVMTVVIMPRVATLHAAGEIETLERLLARTSRRAFLLGMSVLAAIVLFGQWGLGFVFGDEFRSGYLALIVLGAAQSINAAFGPAALLLNMSGNERITLMAIASATLLNLILNSVLIRFMGIEGAAIATACSLIFYKSILITVIRRKIGIRSSAFGI